MRFYDTDENIVYWYHGIDVQAGREKKIFASEFGDDFDAIPAYEQIYALAGPIQTYRITGDPAILTDAEMTVDLFDRFFLDQGAAATSRTSTRSPSTRAASRWAQPGQEELELGRRPRAGLPDQPYLATGEQNATLECSSHTVRHHRRRTSRTTTNSPFVQEKFLEDWSHDQHLSGSRTAASSATTSRSPGT